MMDNIDLQNVDVSEYLKDPNILNIMSSVSNRYSKNIDLDQIDSIKLNTLWECVKKYDSSKGAKFTSFLYQMLDYSFKNELKKKRKECAFESIDSLYAGHNSNNQIKSNEACIRPKNNMELFDGLSKETSQILIQKYIYNMTMVEIGKSNGYSRETARRKLAKAVKIWKNKNQIEC
tara:strand:- start:3456 stop:3983 length:528 start_codon:yes stop_codon:yes gene_type:complete